MKRDVLLTPDGLAAIETLAAQGFTPAEVADALERFVSHGMRRRRMALADLPPHLQEIEMARMRQAGIGED